MRSRFIRQVSVRNYANPSDTFSRAARSVPSIWTDIQIAVLEQVDAASLAVFRIIFGLVGVFIVTRFFAYGWIGELYIEPAHHFTYLGFSWVKPWPGWGMYAHFAALGLLACGIAAGYRYRLCAVLFFVGFAYVELLDKTAYLNHYYWAVLVSLLMAFLPLHSSLSVDSWRRSRNLWGTAPRGALWLLRAQLAAVYVFAGIAKLNADWLLEAQPLHIWMQDHAGVPLIGPLLGEVWVAYVFSEGGAFFDLTIVGWLMWKRTRPAAYAVLVAFHLITYLLFPQIGVFSWLMMGTAPLFFPPDWPRRFLSNLGKRHTSAAAKSSTPPREYGRQNRVSTMAMVAVTVYVVVQVLLPLRHYAYPGNVRWNEEGYRFAWRVLLTEKVGMVEYRVHDPVTGRRWRVGPEDYHTPLQAERMATQPDMILETAHIIARDFEGQGHVFVQVYADVFVAMNGRENARLVDPQVDLTAVNNSFASKKWLLPQGTSYP